MRWWILLPGLLWVVPAGAQMPNLSNAATYYERCAKPTPQDSPYCTAYFIGMHDASSGGMLQFPCFPKDATYGRLAADFLRYLRENSEVLSWRTAAAYSANAGNSYPCPTR